MNERMTTEEYTKIIKDTVAELVVHKHTSENREISGLFKELKNDIGAIRKDLDGLDETVKSLEAMYMKEILPNVKTWNRTSENQSKVVWIIIGAVIVALLGIIGLS